MSLTLEQARRLRGKSQNDMAKLLGIHINTYRRLEKSPDHATIEQAKKISSFLSISYDVIFFASKLYL